MTKKKKENTSEEDNLDFSTYSVKNLSDKVSKLTDVTTNFNKKILHKRSNAFNTDGTPKLPTADQLDYGEIGVNYVDGGEVIALKNSVDEIVAFISKRAFLEAPIVTEADYLLSVKDGEIYLYKEKNVSYRLMGSDVGDSVVVIDDEPITIPTNETIEGTCYDITEITTNNLEEIHIWGDVSLTIGDDNVENDTVKVVELHFNKNFSRSFDYLCRWLTNLTDVTITGGKPTTCYRAFHSCLNLTNINLDEVDFSECTSLQGMMNECDSLTALELNKWDVSSVTNIISTFQNCTSLSSLDISNWDVSSVASINYTFCNCYVLPTIDVSRWDTSAATSMRGIFQSCRSMTAIDVSAWDTSKVTIMEYTFRYCYALVSLNLSGWDMASVTSATNMFQSDTLLSEVIGPISNIKLSLDVSDCPLTRDSALVFINGLSSDVSGQVLSLSSTTKALLTDDDIKIATDKGWTIA